MGRKSKQQFWCQVHRNIHQKGEIVMDKKLLEDIIQTAKAAGEDVKIVQIG